jgi:hypothetical protein
MQVRKESPGGQLTFAVRFGASIACITLMLNLSACSKEDHSSGRSGELTGDWQWQLATGCKETLSFSRDSFTWKSQRGERQGKVAQVKAYRDSQFKGITLALVSTVDKGETCRPDGFLPKLLDGQAAFYLLDSSKTQLLICEQPHVTTCAGPFLRVGADDHSHDHSKD